MSESVLSEQMRITDPSQLTQRQILREVSLLEDKFNVRSNSEEKSIDKLFSQFEKVPDLIDKSVEQHSAINAEKFSSIQTQFRERDIRSETKSKDDKVAVDAALQAQKESVAEQNRSSALAITKSEIATARQIEQINTLIATSNRTTDEKINDIKSRLDLTVGQDTGAKSTKEDSKSWIAISISMVGVLIAIVAAIIAKVY